MAVGGSYCSAAPTVATSAMFREINLFRGDSHTAQNDSGTVDTAYTGTDLAHTTAPGTVDTVYTGTDLAQTTAPGKAGTALVNNSGQSNWGQATPEKALDSTKQKESDYSEGPDSQKEKDKLD